MIKGELPISLCVQMKVVTASQEMVPGIHAMRRFSACPVHLRYSDGGVYGNHDPFGNLVLNKEDIPDIAVITFDPNVPISLSVDQLRRNTNAAPCSPHRALEYVAGTEFLSARLYTNGSTFEGECRIALDNQKPAPF